MSTVNIYTIPVTNVPQSFVINLANVNYAFTVKFNDQPQSGWILDIGDGAGNPLACCLPLITGADLLDGLDYIGIDGQLFVYTNGDPSAVPTSDNLGTDCNLYFQTTVTNNG